MQCSALSFHEVSNHALDHILGRSTIASPAQEAVSKKAATKPEKLSEVSKQRIPAETTSRPVSHSISQKETTALTGEGVPLNTRVFDTILESISKATTTEISDLTDDVELAELGES